MFAALRKLIIDARTAEVYEQREQIANKALRRLNAIEKILITAAQEPSHKGGTKTAQRGLQRRPGMPEVRARKVS
jgi:hypothetical protein